MPKNLTLMHALEKRYGAGKAENIYWGMVGEGKGPFGPGGKYRAEHDAIAARAGGKSLGKKKPPTKKAGGSKRRKR